MYKWCISLVQKSESKDEKQAWFWMNECSRFVFSFWKECFTMELLLSCLICGIIYMDGGGEKDRRGWLCVNELLWILCVLQSYRYVWSQFMKCGVALWWAVENFRSNVKIRTSVHSVSASLAAGPQLVCVHTWEGLQQIRVQKEAHESRVSYRGCLSLVVCFLLLEAMGCVGSSLIKVWHFQRVLRAQLPFINGTSRKYHWKERL